MKSAMVRIYSPCTHLLQNMQGSAPLHSAPICLTFCLAFAMKIEGKGPVYSPPILRALVQKIWWKNQTPKGNRPNFGCEEPTRHPSGMFTFFFLANTIDSSTFWRPEARYTVSTKIAITDVENRVSAASNCCAIGTALEATTHILLCNACWRCSHWLLKTGFCVFLFVLCNILGRFLYWLVCKKEEDYL